MSERFKVRLFQDSDLESLKKYYKSSTGAPFNEELWRWTYMENNARRDHPLAFICTDEEGTFIGCIHSTPTIKRYKGKDYYCTIGSDGFVRQEYRGKGAYNMMAAYLMSKEELLGSMRFSFYNEITKNMSVSAPLLMDTSISIKINNPEKVSRCFFNNRLKAESASLLYKAFKRRKNKEEGIQVSIATPQDYYEYYKQWSNNYHFIHTPRTMDYIEWRFMNYPRGKPTFYSLHDDKNLKGYLITIREKNFQSLPLDTLIISDYLIEENNPDLFGEAVSSIIRLNKDSDIVYSRPFSTPDFQKKLIETGFLDSMFFPLNRLVKPGAMGLRIFDSRCKDFMKKQWYLTESDCF
jgi:hypothetical protein